MPAIIPPLICLTHSRTVGSLTAKPSTFLDLLSQRLYVKSSSLRAPADCEGASAPPARTGGGAGQGATEREGYRVHRARKAITDLGACLVSGNGDMLYRTFEEPMEK